jgi:hypothetical protein
MKAKCRVGGVAAVVIQIATVWILTRGLAQTPQASSIAGIPQGSNVNDPRAVAVRDEGESDGITVTERCPDPLYPGGAAVLICFFQGTVDGLNQQNYRSGG